VSTTISMMAKVHQGILAKADRLFRNDDAGVWVEPGAPAPREWTLALTKVKVGPVLARSQFTTMALAFLISKHCWAWEGPVGKEKHRSRKILRAWDSLPCAGRKFRCTVETTECIFLRMFFLVRMRPR
jgi:hypothetical protein